MAKTRASTPQAFPVPGQLTRLPLIPARPQQIILQIYGTDCLLNLVVYIYPCPPPPRSSSSPAPCWLVCLKGITPGRWIRTAFESQQALFPGYFWNLPGRALCVNTTFFFIPGLYLAPAFYLAKVAGNYTRLWQGLRMCYPPC